MSSQPVTKPPLLSVQGLNAWYDRSHVVQDVSLQVQQGEIVTLMGRNGAGKTTTLRSPCASASSTTMAKVSSSVGWARQSAAWYATSTADKAPRK